MVGIRTATTGWPITGTVYIVDDDPGFTRSLARLLAASGFEVVPFASPAEFLAAGSVPAGATGCVVLDVHMPGGMAGPGLQRAMLERGLDLPVIFLSGQADIATSVGAMKLGAVDFLEKPVRAEILIGAIQAALERQAAARAARADRERIERHLASLSPREREVLDHVIAGRLNKQIAGDLGISIATVKAHRGRVMEKMGVRSVAQLVDMCRAAEVMPAHHGRPR